MRSYQEIVYENQRRSGMGTLGYYDLMAQAGLQNCSPMDSACVSNNVARQAAVEDYWVGHMATGVPDGTVLTFSPQTPAEVLEFYNPQNLFNGGNVVDTRGILNVLSPNSLFNTPTPPVNNNVPLASNNYNPKLVFTTSTGKGTLYPGDSWVINITGARPGTTVYVQGGINEDQTTTRMGIADGGGNYSLGGTIDATNVGSWNETWSAGTEAGRISFSVKLPEPKPISSLLPVVNGTTITNTTMSHLLDNLIPVSVDSIPDTIFGYDSRIVLGVGALGLAFMMFGNHGR